MVNFMSLGFAFCVFTTYIATCFLVATLAYTLFRDSSWFENFESRYVMLNFVNCTFAAAFATAYVIGGKTDFAYFALSLLIAGLLFSTIDVLTTTE